ncbi:DUF5906 domain-containing protein [Thalassospira sp. CH_XMU1458]|uniref:DUF5906 domain-containing protein n=1 Tax=Thalassospira sp. CH_XMU1458 TaxID=3107776 RepID=UPI00300CACA6
MGHAPEDFKGYFAGLSKYDEFKTELLPIIPVDASLSKKSKVSDANRGKVPGLANGSEWSGFPKWQDICANDSHIEYWKQLEREQNCGIGLQARSFPAIDIDVRDATISDAIKTLAHQILGEAPERVGRAPKRLLPYRLDKTSSPIRKRRIDFEAPNGTKHAIEVLGQGQQYVIHGTHPKSQNPYQWENNKTLAEIGPGGLDPVDTQKVDQFISAAKQMLENMSCTLMSETRNSATSKALTANQSNLEGDVDKIKEALDALGNDLSYDEWITMTAAVKAAIGNDPQGYDIYEAWCLEYPGNDAAVARAKWDSVHPPFKVGAEHVYRAAAAKGWGGYGAAVGFTPIGTLPAAGDDDDDDTWTPSIPPDASGNIPKHFDDYIFVEETCRFYCVSERRELQDKAFASRFGYIAGIRSPKNPLQAYHLEPGARRAADYAFRIGEGHFPIVGGERHINLWHKLPITVEAEQNRGLVTNADIKPWLDHCEKIVPDNRERELLFNWLAWCIQHPATRPNWGVFLGGKQGIGKDMLFEPFLRLHGEGEGQFDYVTRVSNNELCSNFTGWADKARVILLEEINSISKDRIDTLKTLITSDHIRIVRKGKDGENSRDNRAAFIAMSNRQDGLPIEPDDRRFFALWSEISKSAFAQDYFEKLVAWYQQPGAIAKIGAWLMDRNLGAFSATGNAPDTAAKAEITNAGLEDWERAIADAIEQEERPFNNDIVLSKDVENFLAQKFGRKAPSMHAAGRFLKDNGAEKLETRIDMTDAGGARRSRVWLLRNKDSYEPLSASDLKAAYLAQEEDCPSAIFQPSRATHLESTEPNQAGKPIQIPDNEAEAARATGHLKANQSKLHFIMHRQATHRPASSGSVNHEAEWPCPSPEDTPVIDARRYFTERCAQPHGQPEDGEQSHA